MPQPSSSRMMFGMPLGLLGGYIAVALFMTGDGIELAFLSKYLVNIGFSESQASLVFSVYGFMVALGSWMAGVCAEIYGPRRLMKWGAVIWIVFHILFLLLGLEAESLAMVLLLYGIRGIGYPLFIYSFVVWIARTAPDDRLASAMGWFWAMYSVGIGFFGTYIPSYTLPLIGFMGTLWFSLIWIVAAALIGLLMMREDEGAKGKALSSTKDKLKELSRGITLLFENRNISLAFIVRIINQHSLFGFMVIMPIFFTDKLGFTTPEWLRIWGAVFITTITTNVLWGICGDRFGWLRQIRWFGCIGMAITCLAFYYIPQAYPGNNLVAIAIAIIYGITLSAFVPMSAMFPVLAPEHRGAAISIHNLSVGLSNFVGPAIATLLLPWVGTEGVIWAYSSIYLLGAVLTFFIKFRQPGLDSQSVADSPETVIT
ncbi:MFS transporter [Halomonas elongata]|uniref:MFS transporter n=1 Tax=Halomonas elongata TaxID=2746 RepID=UPI00186BA494|nr:MFS transporter [Halomonas elongata]MBW5799635.1 MFS transporter [Halomonas elongata]